MMRRPPRSTQSRSSAASDVYKRQRLGHAAPPAVGPGTPRTRPPDRQGGGGRDLHRRRGTGTQRRPGQGKKSLVAVAVEIHEPRGYGRVRMGIIADASAACLHPFITANVEPGGTVITDGWQGYSGIERFGYT